MVVFDVDRLASHTNADDETLYRDPDEIRRAAETGDPIRNLERYLLTSGCSDQALEDIRREVEAEVVAAEAAAYAGPEPDADHDRQGADSGRTDASIARTARGRSGSWTDDARGDARRAATSDAQRMRMSICSARILKIPKVTCSA